MKSERDLASLVARLEAMLGAQPAPIAPTSEHKTMGGLINAYLQAVAVSKSDKLLLNTLYGRIGKVETPVLGYEWIEEWIQEMKVVGNLNPSTIRHYVGAVGRCLDWACRKRILSTSQNPVRQLPKSYAQYTERDAQVALAQNPEFTVQEDDERDRRLEHGEEDRIRWILDRNKPEGRQRPMLLTYQAALELLFDLALETAMRMREIYTLSLDQVDFDRRTIFLDRTKNGDKRQVPMSSVAVERINKYLAHVAAGERGMENYAFPGGRLLPWWDGKASSLTRTTAMLSRQFGRIFDAAGCPDLRFHDLRHEATSRFFERTSMQDFEVMKITGHSSTRMLRRYSNIRGSTLADKLW
ncbi:site-specific integrase [Massilia sp. TN1-12]|uniref:site-specific integrase n=1 Tax=Massilia paldalensis TaxID=3377675 RepID=UPI00384DB343